MVVERIGLSIRQIPYKNGWKVCGNTYSMINAVKMAENMANPKTGGVGDVLYNMPNGTETATFPTFNSMANIVAGCVADQTNGYTLFTTTTLDGGPETTTVLQAIANMTKYPSENLDTLFVLSFKSSMFAPALTFIQKPTSWLLFHKFTGGFYRQLDKDNLMNGPGNVAIDKRSFAWVNDNYVSRGRAVFACAGLRLMKFYPWGESFSKSPYFDDGLSGAGFSIIIEGTREKINLT